MLAVMKKELKTYFFSPIGYVVMGIFLLCFSVFFYLTVISYGTVDLSILYYYTALYGLIIIVPILTMRMFAEERKVGTEQLLYTSPRSITGIVFGKFLAALFVVFITELCTLMYLAILFLFGTPHVQTALVTLLGFFLLSMAYVSFGMFASSLTENQIVSAIITIAVLVAPWFLVDLSSIFSSIDLIDKFMKFPYGLISMADVISLLSITVMCILITIILVKRRKAVK